MKRAVQSGLLIGIFLCVAPLSTLTRASEPISIPTDATDSTACATIEKEHTRGIELWRAKDLSGALDRFKSCEAALKKRSLWMPAKLPEKPTADQTRALEITNKVIFSLASIYQQMGRRADSDRYADEARRRGLLPKVFMSGKPVR